MNTVDAPLYSPAPQWTGRTDGPGSEHARWHSTIKPLDPATPDSVPGIALLGFASNEGVARNHGRPGAAAGLAALPAGKGVPAAIIHELALTIASTGRLALVDVVKLNPTFDLDARTAKLAARLIDDIVTAHFSAATA